MRPLFAAALQILAAAALLTISPPACRAQKWVEREEGLGLDEFRFLVAGGLDYAGVFGSELEHVDPSIGMWASGAYRIRGPLSVSASISRNSAGVSGQLTQLIDVPVRQDGRSGNAEGDVELLRFGAGVRLDALRETMWRYRPYVQAEFLRSFIDVTLDSVDGVPPVDDSDYTRSSFDTSQWGARAKAGVDYRLNSMIGVDLGAAFEFLEFPAGTSSIASIQGGASFRF